MGANRKRVDHDQLVLTRISETNAGEGKFFKVPGVVICPACVAYYYAVLDILPLGFINIAALGIDTTSVRLLTYSLGKFGRGIASPSA